MKFFILFIVLVLLFSTLFKAVLKHFEYWHLLKDMKHFVADVVGCVVAAVFYAQVAVGLFDWELLKDLALGYLVAIRTFDYIYKYVEKWILNRLV